MNKNDIISYIKKEFADGRLRRDMFPMMTEFGIRDYSETVHTVGLNYITAIGRSLDGVAALSECPVYPNNKENANAISGIKDTVVRPDSVWFSKEDNKAILISEFERYEKNRRKDLMIKEKIENLLIAYHQLGGGVPVILFVYWSYTTENPSDIKEYISILDNGFRNRNGVLISGINTMKTTYLIYRCVANGTSENLKLDQWVEVG